MLLLLLIALVAAVAVGGGGGGGGSAKQDEPPADEGAGTATMTDVKMATDEEGRNPTRVFSPNDTFHCVGYLENAPEDTAVKAVWIASDVEGVKAGTVIKRFSAQGGSGLFHFDLSPTDSWPTGEYGVGLYLDGAKEPTKALVFEVR